jgi:hypothetical protein
MQACDSRRGDFATSAAVAASFLRDVRSGVLVSALAVCALLGMASADDAMAGVSPNAEIAVPNGDFSDPANEGAIGGGLLGGAATDVMIGEGPWLGSYNSVLGLLAPPTLAISPGFATVGGLAGVDVLGILNNGGYFSQTLATVWVPERLYTLGVDVDAGGVLGLDTINNGNVGVELVNEEGDVVASSVTAPTELVSLTLLNDTTYRLELNYISDSSAAGTIGVRLITRPVGVLGVGLLTTVQFSNVTLEQNPVNPTSDGVIASGGTPQDTPVNTEFPEPLVVRVVDQAGDPVSGVDVGFVAPDSGASAALSAPTATTDANGEASITATANTVAGSYTVAASVAGVDLPASFNLTNTAGPAAAIEIAGGGEQSAVINTSFASPLVVLVTDDFGNPVAGEDVDFAVPTAGASASLSGILTTDASGTVSVVATANAVTGSYVVAASVAGLATMAEFHLTNVLGDDVLIDPTGDDDQDAQVDTAFRCALAVQVTDSGLPQGGLTVEFAAPATGPSAVLSDGVTSGSTVQAITGLNGVALVKATANDIAGSYEVTATLLGSGAPPVVFDLTNLADLLFANGFDGGCILIP